MRIQPMKLKPKNKVMKKSDAKGHKNLRNYNKTVRVKRMFLCTVGREEGKKYLSDKN
jgi:hypothetical protein